MDKVIGESANGFNDDAFDLLNWRCLQLRVNVLAINQLSDSLCTHVLLTAVSFLSFVLFYCCACFQVSLKHFKQNWHRFVRKIAYTESLSEFSITDGNLKALEANQVSPRWRQ